MCTYPLSLVVFIFYLLFEFLPENHVKWTIVTVCWVARFFGISRSNHFICLKIDSFWNTNQLFHELNHFISLRIHIAVKCWRWSCQQQQQKKNGFLLQRIPAILHMHRQMWGQNYHIFLEKKLKRKTLIWNRRRLKVNRLTKFELKNSNCLWLWVWKSGKLTFSWINWEYFV